MGAIQLQRRDDDHLDHQREAITYISHLHKEKSRCSKRRYRERQRRS
jgi:hypothetical protein